MASERAVEAPDPTPMGVVIPLFKDQRSCFTCEHARFPETPAGIITYCTVYDQSIDSELYEAEDCSTYGRCEEGSQPDVPPLEE